MLDYVNLRRDDGERCLIGDIGILSSFTRCWVQVGGAAAGDDEES